MTAFIFAEKFMFMAKIENRKKQNPKLQQSELSDGRASLYLEYYKYYIGRTETPVLDENGEQVFYTEGAMAGKPKFKIKHTRKKENLNPLHLAASENPAGVVAEQERPRARREDTLRA